MGHKKSYQKILLIPLLVVLILIAAFLCLRMYQRIHESYDIHLADGRIQVKSLSALKEELQKRSDASRMNITLNTRPELYEQGQKGDVYIANDVTNKQAIQVNIKLKKNGKLVLQSKCLQPGAVLYGGGLQTSLHQGNYPAIAEVSYMDAHGKVTTRSQVDMVLAVKS